MVCIRSVNIDDLEQLYKIEQRCFPQAEAASKEVLLPKAGTVFFPFLSFGGAGKAGGDGQWDGHPFFRHYRFNV